MLGESMPEVLRDSAFLEVSYVAWPLALFNLGKPTLSIPEKEAPHLIICRSEISEIAQSDRLRNTKVHSIRSIPQIC
jgi:hypothetical protein